MVEALSKRGESASHEPHAPYLKVFALLLALTVLEYLYAMGASSLGLPFLALVLGLVVMALTKAVLVAMYFMHVKYEGRWVYLLIVPSCLMALILVIALYPDIGRVQGGRVPTQAAGPPSGLLPEDVFAPS